MGEQDDGDQAGAGGSGSEPEKPESEQPPRGPLHGLAAPYILVGAVLVGAGIGYLIDNHFGTQPWWTVGMTGLFMIAGFYHIVRDSMR